MLHKYYKNKFISTNKFKIDHPCDPKLLYIVISFTIIFPSMQK